MSGKSKEEMLKAWKQKQKLADQRRKEKLSEHLGKSELFNEKVNKMRAKKQLEIEEKKKRRLSKERAVRKSKNYKLKLIKQKAEEYKMKASEISFLMMLEKETKRRDLDLKLEETHERKMKIIHNIQKEKNKKRKRRESHLEKQRQNEEDAQKKLIKKYKGKMGRAKKLRKAALNEKVKGKGSARKIKLKSKPKILLLDFSDNLDAMKLEMKLAKEQLDQRMEKGVKVKVKVKPKDKDLSNDDERASSFDFADLSLDPEQKAIRKRKESGACDNTLRKKNKKRKRKKKKQIKKEKVNELLSSEPKQHQNDNTLHDYYKFLIKESDYSTKKRKLSFNSLLSEDIDQKQTMQMASQLMNDKFEDSSLKTSQLSLEKSKEMESLNLSQNKEKDLPTIKDSIPRISEMPELICRDIKQTKKESGVQQTRLCILCDVVLEDETDKEHLLNKNHKKNKSQYVYTSLEESNCIILCSNRELVNERLSYLKKKSKKIRYQISIQCMKFESKNVSKENYPSENKKKLQTLALELEKQMRSTKRDLDTIRNIFIQFRKTLDKNIENDLHLCRQIKIPILLIDFFKSVVSCPKFELNTMIELINDHFSLLLKICLLRENRISIYYNNRVTSLVDLLLWAWVNMQKHVLCMNFLPDIFHTLNLLLKQRLFSNSGVIKPLVIKYTLYSGLFQKIRQKFLNYASNNILVLNPRIAVLSLKALTLMGTITSQLQNNISNELDKLNKQKFVTKSSQNVISNRWNPLEENSLKKGNNKITELVNSKQTNSLIFILNETECAGCLHLLASILLSKGFIYYQLTLLIFKSQ